MSNFNNWIFQKRDTLNLALFDKISVGFLNNNIVYDYSGCINNPLHITYNQIRYRFDIRINDKFQEFDNVQLYRLKKSPFYFTVIQNKSSTIYIYDFFDADKQEIYRAFDLIYPKTNFFDLTVTGDTIDRKFKAGKDSTYFFKISKDAITPQKKDFKPELKILYRYYEKNNIGKYFILKNEKAENECDLLWNQQKFIRINKKNNQNHFSESTQKYWSSFVENYFDFEYKSNYGKDLDSYLSSIFKCGNDKICDKTIKWWALHSKPVFLNKIINQFEKKPEFMLAVYLSAAKNYLYFSDSIKSKLMELFKITKKSEFHYLLNFILFLTERILVIKREDGFSFYPTAYFDNNFKAVYLDKSEITCQYSKYSKEYYSTILIREKIFFRINKLCVLHYNSKQIKVEAPLSEKSQPCNIFIQNFTYTIPLIWPKFSITIKDIRFSVILKKNRYQFTIKNKGGSGYIKINENTLTILANSRTIFYLDCLKTDPEVSMNVFDNNGSPYLSAKDEISFFYGHAVNHNGIYSEYLNIRYKTNKQNWYKIHPPGYYYGRLEKKNNSVNSIDFIIKKYCLNYKLNYLNAPFLAKFYNIKSTELASHLICCVDQKFSDNFDKIFDFFKDNFSAHPYYMNINQGNLRKLFLLSIEFVYSKSKKEMEIHDERLIIYDTEVEYGLKKLKKFLYLEMPYYDKLVS